jgi:cytochrome b6-f complex iron-sulfur subunit
MAEYLQRRQFLTRMWGAGTGLLAVAAAWTSWDLLQPLVTSGFGGLVRAILPASVPDAGVVDVPAARAYLTKVNGDVVALSQKCTHLGCRVPFCDSSGRFECPCHGSVFTRSGAYVAGPAPRGMDRYPTSVGEDGLVYIDTGSRVQGPAPGSVPVEPVSGPACSAGGDG